MSASRLYQTPEELDAMVDAYVADCEMRNQPLGFVSMALFLGFSSRTGIDYYLKYENMTNSVARAKAIVEASYEHDLRRANNSGARFALSNYGWKNNSDVAVSSPDGSMSPNRVLSEDELEQELKRRGIPRRLLDE